MSNDKHEVSASFDGGDTGCGELLLDLLLFMRRQPAGAIVEVARSTPVPRWKSRRGAD